MDASSVDAVGSLKWGFGNKVLQLLHLFAEARALRSFRHLYVVQEKSHHEVGVREDRMDYIFDLPAWVSFISWKEFDIKKKHCVVISNQDWFTNKFIKLPRLRAFMPVSDAIIANIPKLDFKNGIAVHVRYGDKATINKQKGPESYVVMSPAYYTEMVKKFPPGPVYIFTDSPDFCKRHLRIPNSQIVETGYAETFYCLTQFRQQVIGESTLSISAAYFGPKKTVYAPDMIVGKKGTITHNLFHGDGKFIEVRDRSMIL